MPAGEVKLKLVELLTKKLSPGSVGGEVRSFYVEISPFVHGYPPTSTYAMSMAPPLTEVLYYLLVVRNLLLRFHDFIPSLISVRRQDRCGLRYREEESPSFLP